MSSIYKIERQYDFSAQYRKKRPQICDRFGYATVIIGFTAVSYTHLTLPTKLEV